MNQKVSRSLHLSHIIWYTIVIIFKISKVNIMSKVKRNWPEYNSALVNRGYLIVLKCEILNMFMNVKGDLQDIAA